MFPLQCSCLCSGYVSATPHSSSYASGPFTIHYDSTHLPTLRVMQQERLVWFTSNSTSPFVNAAKVNTEVTQIGGDYTFKREIVEKCSQLKVTDVGSRLPNSTIGEFYSTIFIRGVLCDVVPMEMTFQAVNLSSNGAIFHHLQFNLSLSEDSHYNQLHLLYGCGEGEGFYGFGAQYSHLNMKGKVLPLFLSEQGVGRGLQPVTFLLDDISPGAGDELTHL